MLKNSNSAKQPVALQPSKIRRDPVREEKQLVWRSREWEVRLSVAGIVLFALALCTIWIGLNEVTFK